MAAGRQLGRVNGGSAHLRAPVTSQSLLVSGVSLGEQWLVPGQYKSVAVSGDVIVLTRGRPSPPGCAGAAAWALAGAEGPVAVVLCWCHMAPVHVATP